MPELREAARVLRRNPLVAGLAVLSLALAVGANTAIFSMLDALLLRPLPVVHADRLALLTTGTDWFGSAWTNPIWESVRDRPGLHDGAFAFRTTGFNLADEGVVDPVVGLQASGDVFDVLGVAARLGRTFTAVDDRRDGGPDGPVAVLSHDFWQARFGGASDVVGRTIRLNRVDFTIVGVTPAGFFGPEVGRRFDVAVPLGTVAILDDGPGVLDSRSSWWLRVMIRMPPGQTIERAMAAFRLAQPEIARETRPAATTTNDAADHLGVPFVLEPATTGSSEVRGRYRTPVIALMAIVSLTLLMACANIANLLLARSAVRRHEFSLRAALGASGRRLARALIAESLLLSTFGTVLGVLFAAWGTRLLLAQLSTTRDPVYLDTGLNWRLLAFAAAVMIATVVVFGTAPALRAARAAPMEALKERGRGSTGKRGSGNAGWLVVVQFATSFVLLLCATMFVRTFTSLTNLDTGFDRDQSLLVHMGSPGSGIPVDARATMYGSILQEVRGMPAVAHAGLSLITPLAGSNTTRFMEFPDRPDLARAERRVWLNIISAGWFEALGMQMVAGRAFDERDAAGAPRTAIVNETFVDTYFRGENAIGRTIRQTPEPGADATPIEIVGVVGDAVYRSLREPIPPTMYWAVMQQNPMPAGLSLVVRPATGTASALARNMVDAIRRVRSDLTLVVSTIEGEVNAALTQERILAATAGIFGLLALLLAGIGLYGVTAQSVAQRRTEIGIRMALGATKGGAVRLVLARVAALMIVGLIVGGALGAWGASAINGLMFGITTHDLESNAVSATILLGIGVLATLVPSMRAARTDPATVIRSDA